MILLVKYFDIHGNVIAIGRHLSWMEIWNTRPEGCVRIDVAIGG